MQDTSHDFLRRLMATHAPTGYEQEAARVFRDEAAKFADHVEADTLGNSCAVINPGGSPRIMLAGHIDEIGLMVTCIDDKGFLSFDLIGGWDLQVLPGQRVRILTKNGIVLGVIGKKPIHLMKDEERRTAVKRDDLSIEIGARDKAEAASIVAIGDPAVLDYDMAELRNGLFVARGFDDRIGAYVVLEALRILARERPKAAVYGVATVQEEVGLRGAMASAFGVNPKVGIAVDVTHGTDSPSTESEKKHLGEISLGKGPVLARGANINPRLFEILVAAAEEKQIAYQIEPAPGPTGTDAAAIQVARAGVATALVSVPNRYMHSPCEVVHEADLAASAELIAAAVMRIGDDTNFVP